jgi:hypothetical protein
MLMDQRDEHEVQEGSLDAHFHDHTHAVGPAKGKYAAHIHWHRHLDDREDDEKLNGHTHPLRHRKLPWEANEDA